MPRFRKKIVSAGKHNAVMNGSTRETTEITPDRLKHWVDSFNQMKAELGYVLPNPAVHYDENGIPPKPITITEKGELVDPTTGKETLWRSDLNLGFWDNLFIDEDGDLAGEVEAPGDPDDPNTPAGKLGKTIKETSVGAAKSYVDGKGKKWDDVLVHVASCVKAVEPNQENFIPSSEGEYAMMSMSTLISDDANNPGNTGESESISEEGSKGNHQKLKEVMRLLKEIGIDLPEDTSQDNLIERLEISLRQRVADDKEQDENLVQKPPKPAGPNKQPQDSTEKSGVTTMSDQEKKVDSDLTLDMTMSIFSEQKKSSMAKRLDAIVEMGALTKEQQTQLFGDLEMFTMSQADFDPATKSFKKSKIEFGLDCIEAVLANLKEKVSDDKVLTTMSTLFTDGYNSENDKEHKNPLSNDDGEPLGEDEPFMQGAMGY